MKKWELFCKFSIFYSSSLKNNPNHYHQKIQTNSSEYLPNLNKDYTIKDKNTKKIELIREEHEMRGRKKSWIKTKLDGIWH